RGCGRLLRETTAALRGTLRPRSKEHVYRRTRPARCLAIMRTHPDARIVRDSCWRHQRLVVDGRVLSLTLALSSERGNRKSGALGLTTHSRDSSNTWNRGSPPVHRGPSTDRGSPPFRARGGLPLRMHRLLDSPRRP